ncbi:hypothetical protein [Sphingomonas sp. DC2300-3]
MPDPDDSTDPTKLTDKQLLDAYEATPGEAGDAAADRLLVRIRRRGLDL